MPSHTVPVLQFLTVTNPEQAKDRRHQKLVRRHVVERNFQNRIAKQKSSAPLPQSLFPSRPASASTALRASKDSHSNALICDCFGQFADIIAVSKHTREPLSVQDCPMCGMTCVAPKSILLNDNHRMGGPSDTRLTVGNSPIQLLGSGTADPFASYSVAMNSEMYGLMYHMMSVMTPLLSPVDERYITRTNTKISFQFSISNPTVLHATLAVASMHQSLCTQSREMSVYTALHRGEAIRLMNRMLEDEQQSISDEMIGSVVRLSSYEIFTGDFRGWVAHAKALKEIVRRRGGLENLGLRGGIKRQCYEMDVMGSMIGGTQPVFSPVPETLFSPEEPIVPIDLSPLIQTDASLPTFLADTGFYYLASSGYISPALIQILSHMRLLLVDLYSIENSTSFSSYMLLFTTKRTFVEYALLSHNFVLEGFSLLNEPVRLAALIFSNRVSRNYPPQSGVHVSLVAQLQAALQLTDLARSWSGFSNVLLWICLVGGIVSRSPEPRGWFQIQLRYVCETMHATSWKTCRSILHCLLWHDRRLEEAARQFWLDCGLSE